MTGPRWARQRDLVLAFLTLLRAMATGVRPVDARLLADVPADSLTELVEAIRRGPDPGVPRELWHGADSGIDLVLNAVTGGDQGEPSSASALAAVVDEFADTLLDLGAAFEDAAGRSAPAAPVIVVTDAAGRCAATTLWPVADEASRHPWLTPLPSGGTAAVRKALSPFGSLRDVELPSDGETGYLWPPGVPGTPVHELHGALTALAQVTGLVVPENLVAIGRSDGDGFRPVTDAEAADHAAAVAHLHCDLLVPVAQGWRLSRAGADDKATVITGQRDVDAVAGIVWGEEWERWKRAQHRAELLLLGWVPVDPSDRPPHRLVPEVDVSQVDSLFFTFHSERKVAVLGGPKSSGKSVIVRRLAARLARQSKPPVVRVIASLTHELPDPQLALRIGAHALGMDEAKPRQRRLLVLEDLHPVGAGDVDGLLRRLSDELNASILAVLQYDTNSMEEWQTDHLNVITAVVGRAALSTFVQQVGQAFPDLDQAAALAELEKQNATRDVHRLIQIMLDPEAWSSKGGAVPRAESDLAAWFRSLDGADRDLVATAAAHSMVRSGVPSADAERLSTETRERVALQPNPDGTRWRIPSPETCRTILLAHQAAAGGAGKDTHQSHPLDDTMAALLLPRLTELCDAGSAEVLVLLRGIRLYRNATCAEVVERAWQTGALKRWIRETRSARVAELLVSLKLWLGNDVVNYAVRFIVRRLVERGESCDVRETLTILRCMRANLSEVTPQWPNVSEWIRNQVLGILTAGAGTPEERFAMLRRVDSFHDPMLKRLIAEHAIDVLPGVEHTHVGDYALVRQVRGLQYRAERALEWEQSHVPIEQEEAVQRLLATEPPKDAGFHVLIAWLTLFRYFRQAEWKDLLDEYEPRFPQAMRHTTAQEFSRTINDLRSFFPSYTNLLLTRGFARNPRKRVQTDRGFFDAVRKVLYDSTPIEAADVIRSVSSAHVSGARELLYTNPRSEVPDEELARTLADKTIRLNDSKGAGMLLSVCHLVDDLYGVTSTGFAQCFGACLGEERVLDLLRKDPRPSVRYYLIKGLWEAQVPFRRACLDVANEIVTEAITTSRRAWGPRLALQLASDPDIGQDFAQRLRDRIPPRFVLEGMEHHSSPESQVEFHRLARALYPTVVNPYAEGFRRERFLRSIAGALPVAALECCREVGRTLAEADYPNGGRDIVAAADTVLGEADAWANRLARTRSGEHFAQALNILLDIDHATARAAVAALGARSRKDDENESVLVWKVRHAILDSPTAAASLMASLETIDPGLGRAMYDHLLQDQTLFNIFSFELQLLESPSAQYTAARHLVPIGVLPGQPKTDWISWVYQMKLRLVAMLGNPQVLSDILRMLGLWRRDWAERAGEAVDAAKVCARLRVGLSRDLAPAIDLAALLFDLDQLADCTEIVDQLGQLDQFDDAAIVRHVGLRQACKLLELLSLVRPQRAHGLAEEIDTATGARLAQAFVVDDRGRWIEIGHACHALSRFGRAVRTKAVPHLAPNPAHYAAVVWGLHALPAADWLRLPLRIGLERLYSNPPEDNLSLFCGFALSGDDSRVRDWPAARIPLLSFRQLRVLCDIAGRDSTLAARLLSQAEELRDRLAEPAARLEWDALRLARSLTRLEEQRGIS